MRTQSEDIFQVNAVVEVDGKPALITQRESAWSEVIGCFVLPNGELGDSFKVRSHEVEKRMKGIDHAKIRTVVALPENYTPVAYDVPKENKGLPGYIEPERHPSYGTVMVSRISGQTALFMSPFEHQHYMQLRVHRASRLSSFGHDTNFGSAASLLEINLSEAQWVAMITSANMGGGTPCTIDSVGMKSMPECPRQKALENVTALPEKTAGEISNAIDAAITKGEAALAGKTVSKTQLKEVVDAAKAARLQFDSNLPYILKVMRENMDKIVTAGKVEVETHILNSIKLLGLKSLQALSGSDKMPFKFLEPENKKAD